MKTVYTFDGQGHFVDLYIAQESPLEPGVFLVPTNATEIPPPKTSENERAVWSGQGWTVSAVNQDTCTVAEALTAKKKAIEERSNMLQQQNFVYNGREFYADGWATKTLESCLSVSLALGLAATDPVRVPLPLHPGYWFTAEQDASGNRVVVPFSVGDLKAAVTALYDRNGAIWGKQMIHEATLDAMVAEGATAAQIAAYDHTAGWDS